MTRTAAAHLDQSQCRRACPARVGAVGGILCSALLVAVTVALAATVPAVIATAPTTLSLGPAAAPAAAPALLLVLLRAWYYAPPCCLCLPLGSLPLLLLAVTTLFLLLLLLLCLRLLLLLLLPLLGCRRGEQVCGHVAPQQLGRLPRGALLPGDRHVSKRATTGKRLTGLVCMVFVYRYAAPLNGGSGPYV